ncbi:MAG: DivIVA domain-containing protein [Bifidobacteriaceae bacterium]|jgi:DivIVA domain-containing protein|nr:DivIVA domain-containing protein [Bifidobacteriaceae bacterium]
MTILTLDDIKNVEFRPARLKEGYLADEVDKFIDDVIETFAAKPSNIQTPETKDSKSISSDETNEKIAQLEKELQSTKEELEASNQTKEKLVIELDEIKKTKVAADKDVEMLKADLAKSKALNAQSSSDVLEEITNLNNDKEDVNKKLLQAEQEIKALSEKLKSYESQINSENDSANDIGEFEQKYNESLAENLLLKDELEALKKSASQEAKEKISELEDELNITETRLNKTKAELENAVAENVKNTEEIIKLRKTIQMYEEEPKTGATQAIINAGINASSEKEIDQVSSMLLLATKLRDEYIIKAREDAEKTKIETNIKAEEIINSAKKNASETLEKLSRDRSILETRIDELRLFEADYRSKISKQLNQILGELKSVGVAE